jgi:hypothetical protein
MEREWVSRRRIHVLIFPGIYDPSEGHDLTPLAQCIVELSTSSGDRYHVAELCVAELCVAEL